MNMNEHAKNKDHLTVSELAAHIPDEEVMDVNPMGDDSISVSASRIKQLAQQKREDYLNRNEEQPMKKKISFSVALIAAMMCILSVTAFATFGGMEFIRSIFGDSTEMIQNEIVTPQIMQSANGRDFALEALVTDGYSTHMVVSLTGAQPQEGEDWFTLTTEKELRFTSWSLMESFTTPEKAYYLIDTVSTERFDTASVTIALNADIAPIELAYDVTVTLGNVVIDFPAGTQSGEVELKQMQISSMGFLLVGHESAAAGGLPETHIQLVREDGTVETMDAEFAASDDTVLGGGGAILGGDSGSMPLVSSFQGERNPDGELVVSGQFSRIINPENIAKVIVQGIEFSVK